MDYASSGVDIDLEGAAVASLIGSLIAGAYSRGGGGELLKWIRAGMIESGVLLKS